METAVYTSLELFQSYQGVFSTAAGQIVLEDLKRAHHLYSSLVRDDGGPIDPMQMAIAEGERNVILRILAILQTKESDYATI